MDDYSGADLDTDNNLVMVSSLEEDKRIKYQKWSEKGGSTMLLTCS